MADVNLNSLPWYPAVSGGAHRHRKAERWRAGRFAPLRPALRVIPGQPGTAINGPGACFACSAPRTTASGLAVNARRPVPTSHSAKVAHGVDRAGSEPGPTVVTARAVSARAGQGESGS